MPRVNPQILAWARETAGLSPDDAAQKLGFRDVLRRTAVDRLLSLETGIENPSRAVLLKMAKQYRRPLLVFYLSAPPPRGDRGQDFRTLPDAPDPGVDALVDALIRDVRARQQMVRSVLDDDDAPRLAFVGSKSIEDGIKPVAEDIKRFLGFSTEHFYREPTPESAFSLLRESIEGLGGFVLLIGNLGSHHSTIEPDVFRGFALADPVAPFIVVNDQDAKSAWSFTLLHELVHLWLGETGVSGGRPSQGIERFCNEVASEILLPAESFNEINWPQFDGVASMVRAISQFSRPRNLSYSMVAYRLYSGNVISRELWEDARRYFLDMWRNQRASARTQARENNESGPSYYTVRRHRLGQALIKLVSQQIDDGELTPTKAAKILGVKARNVYPLVAGIGVQSRRVAR